MIQINFEAGNEFKMTSSAENKVQNFFECIWNISKSKIQNQFESMIQNFFN